MLATTAPPAQVLGTVSPGMRWPWQPLPMMGGCVSGVCDCCGLDLYRDRRGRLLKPDHECGFCQRGEREPGYATQLGYVQAESAESPKLAQAEAFLIAELADGPRLARELTDGAVAAGITESTLFKARHRIGIDARSLGFQKAYEWTMPAEVA